MKPKHIQKQYSSEEYASAIFENSPDTFKKMKDVFTKDEIKMLTKRSNFKGALSILSIWGAIASIFSVMAYASTLPLTIAIPAFIVSCILMAGRQLALGVAVHDASHNTLFDNKWANRVITDWLCARPTWHSLEKYRPYHFKHHTRTTMDDDPDLLLFNGFPTTKSSMLRKFVRDLSGYIGLKYFGGRILMDLEILQWTINGDVKWNTGQKRSLFNYVSTFVKNILPMLITNVLLYLALNAFDFGWLYLFWVVPYFTFFLMFTRIRSMAEHGGLERTNDMFLNTRTTKAGWLARMTVAPLHVNYHQEHHIMAACPHYNLPKAHKILMEKNVVSEPPNYFGVLNLLSAKVS